MNRNDIWSFYNPKKYRLKLVQFEDDKRFVGVDLYQRKPLLYKCGEREKTFKEKLKNLVSIMML